MTNELHLMLDIETMSSASDAAVVAIGARLFTVERGPGKGFEGFIDPNEAVKYGSMSDNTMDWWHKQPAYEQVFSGKGMPADVLHRFIAFVKEHKPDTVWANSPSFDCVIMRHMCKQLQLQFPFHYRAERDYRTLMGLGRKLGVDVSECYAGITAHSPLDDATGQAKAACMVLSKLYGLSTPDFDSGPDSGPVPVADEPPPSPSASSLKGTLHLSGRRGSSG